MERERTDYTGRRYGKWQVLYFVKFAHNSRKPMWMCKCTCGTEKVLRIDTLVAGTSIQCKKCSDISKEYSGIIPKEMWILIQRRGIDRHGTFNISIEEGIKLYEEQNRKCALSGLPIYFARNSQEYLGKKQTASLDRINSLLPYQLGNVQWVHKRINLMKNTLSQEEFIYMCKHVANKWYDYKNPSF